MNREFSLDEFMDVISSDKRRFSELIEAVSEISKINQIPEDEEKIRWSEAKSFFETAEYDFKSAKILYAAGLYSTAVYHLQQAVEESVKAYMLMFFGLNKKEIKNYVSHDSPKAFLKLLDKFKRILKPVLLLAKQAPFFDTWIPEVSDQNIRKLESSVKRNKEHIAKMGSKEIKNLITLGYRLIEVLEGQKDQEMIKDKLIETLVAIKKEFDEIDVVRKRPKRDGQSYWPY